MGLVIPRLDEGKRFSRQESVLLQHEGTVGPVSIVMSATVQQMESGRDGVVATGASSGVQLKIPPESLDLVDWNNAYVELLGCIYRP